VCSFFFSCPVCNTAAPVVQTAGVLEYRFRPMSLGPCDPCMQYYIATLLGLDKSIEKEFLALTDIDSHIKC
jgi:hypothetical protein